MHYCGPRRRRLLRSAQTGSGAGAPGAAQAQNIHVRVQVQVQVQGKFLRDVLTLNQGARTSRIFGPDETASDLLGAVFKTCGCKAVQTVFTGCSSWLTACRS